MAMETITSSSLPWPTTRAWGVRGSEWGNNEIWQKNLFVGHWWCWWARECYWGLGAGVFLCCSEWDSEWCGTRPWHAEREVNLFFVGTVQRWKVPPQGTSHFHRDSKYEFAPHVDDEGRTRKFRLQWFATCKRVLLRCSKEREWWKAEVNSVLHCVLWKTKHRSARSPQWKGGPGNSFSPQQCKWWSRWCCLTRKEDIQEI